jgi:outer membrane protein assembly factor BamB
VDSSPTVAYETVYIGSNCGRFYALDTRLGGIKWTFELKKYYLPTSAILAEGVVYFNSYGGLWGGITHALDAATGQEKWKYKTGKVVRCTPSIADGVVYFGSNDGYIYALSLSGNHGTA